MRILHNEYHELYGFIDKLLTIFASKVKIGI